LFEPARAHPDDAMNEIQFNPRRCVASPGEREGSPKHRRRREQVRRGPGGRTVDRPVELKRRGHRSIQIATSHLDKLPRPAHGKGIAAKGELEVLAAKRPVGDNNRERLNSIRKHQERL